MAESGLDSLRQTHAIDVTWKSFELRPPESPPVPSEVRDQMRSRVSAGRARMQEHARNVFGLEMGEGRYGTPSRLAHQAAKFAESSGKGDTFRHALFAAHWQESRDISDVETLVALGIDAGLEVPLFREALESGSLLGEVLSDENEARDSGISAVPAFVFADRYLVEGAQPPDVLRRIADRVREILDQGHE